MQVQPNYHMQRKTIYMLAICLFSYKIHTYDKNRFHNNVGDDCLVDHRRFPLISKSGTIRNNNGDIESAYEDQPIPARLKHTIMRQNETRFLNSCSFVLRQSRCMEKVLKEKDGDNVIN